MTMAPDRLTALDPKIELGHGAYPAVAARIQSQALANPDRVAIRWMGREYDYRQVWGWASFVAERVGHGERVAVCAKRGPGAVAAIVGVLSVGAILVPIDSSLPWRRRQLMLTESRATKVIVVGQLDLEIDDALEVLKLDESDPPQIGPDAAARVMPESFGEAGAYIFFTSGTTGVPKGVLGIHRSLDHIIDWMVTTFEIDARDRFAHARSLSFDAVLREILTPLAAGATLCIAPDPFVPDHALQWIAAEEVTVIGVTPSHASVWLSAASDLAASSLRLTLFSGEVLSDVVAGSWRQRLGPGGRIANLYGPTETTMIRTYHEVDGHLPPGPQPAGHPITHSQILVVDPENRLCEVGEAGEVLIRTSYGTYGYINDPDSQSSVFVQNPFSDRPGDLVYRTGDRGWLREDGSLVVSGRFDDQVQILGVRIEPAEISVHLAAHPGVSTAAVVVDDASGPVPSLTAYLVARQSPIADGELRRYLAELIPGPAIPGRFVFIEAMPLTFNGKVDRARLTTAARHRSPASEQTDSRLAALSPEKRKLLELRLTQRLDPRAKSAAAGHEGLQTGPPLSSAQERLWFIDRLHPGRSTYNISRAFRLTGVLDVDRLRRALDSIQARHEVLRTTYRSHDGVPYQAVSGQERVAFELIDLSAPDQGDVEEAINQIVQREAKKPFDLLEGPVWRVKLVAISPERHILIIAFHHIASDGWSMPILFRELASHYRAGGRADLAALPIQYTDYASRQRSRLATGEFDADLRYWEDQLAGLAPLLGLPSDRPRPRSPSSLGARHRFLLPDVERPDIESLVRTLRVTPFMVGLSLFVGFLHRLAGTGDLVVGIPSADRPSTDVEDLIGFFVNSLAIRARVYPGMSFRQLLEQIRETSIEAYNHRQVPFEHVVNRVNPVRSADRSPIFQVFFQSANNFEGRLELDDIAVEPVPHPRTVTKFDMTLYLGLLQDAPSGNLVYARDLFDQETVVRMMDGFATFAAGALAEPDRHLSDLPMGSIATAVAPQSRKVQPPVIRTEDTPRSGVATANPATVERMIEIWRDLLGSSLHGPDDDFFAHGGHSLLAVRLLSRIENEWKVELPIGALFDSATPRLLSGQVDAARTALGVIERRGQSRAPLTFAQRRLWFLDQLSPGSANYHIPWRVGLKGELDRRALQVALDRLVARHAALRTRIVEIEGEPEQQVDPASPVKIEFEDVTALGPDIRESQVSTLLLNHAGLPFDLARDSMLRVMLIKTGNLHHILSIVTHHIASDADSMRILKKELKAAYDAEVIGRDWVPAVLPFEYTDMAEWQQQRFSVRREPGLAYWLERLGGELPVLDLRPDHPRPRTITYAGGRVTRWIGNEVSSALLEVARSQGATPFMTLLAAFGVFLHRHTRQEDVIVGVAGTERVIPGTEGMIGFLVNTLPIRLQSSYGISHEVTFVDYLAQTRQRVVEAMDHGQVPFEAIVERVDPPRDPGRSPIYQVTFGLTDAAPGRFELAGLETTPTNFRPAERNVKFDLSLHCSIHRDRIRATFGYRSDLFRRATVKAFADQFATLLKSIADFPDLPLEELNLVPASEKELAMREEETQRHAGGPGADDTPFRLFSEHARSQPDAIAIDAPDGKLSYEELLSGAIDLGARLTDLGVLAGEPVAILGQRSAAMVVAILGTLAAGAAYVPIDSTYPELRIGAMLEDAGITTALTCTSEPTNPTIVLSKRSNSTSVAGGDVAYLMYTSGSTGRAKAVKITHRGIVVRFRSPAFLDVGPNDVLAFASSVSFDASTFELWSALLNGASLVVVPPEVLLTPPRLAEFLRKKQVTIALIPTALFNTLVAEKPDAFGTLRDLVVGGEAADAATMRRCLLHGAPQRLINAYGPTEATVLATHHQVTLADTEQPSVPIGLPATSTLIRIADERLYPVPAGMPGELLIGGEGLAAGYHRDPDLTETRFVTIAGERFYRTGDLAMRRPGSDGGLGTIQFMGRLDRQLKIRGQRLEPGEIEFQLLAHPGVLEAALVPRIDHGEVRLVAYLVGSGETQNVKSHLAQRLPPFMVPSSFIWLEAIPHTPQGKVDVTALPVPGIRVDDQVELPDPDEQSMARLWELVLNRAPVGRNDNFFDLGGHSLLAVKLFASIEATFGVRPPLATVFEAPTVAALTRRVKTGFASPGSELVEIRRGRGGPALFLIHPAGGNVMCYQALAHHLGPEQGVFGIQAVGVDGVQPPHRSVEAMASHYVDVITSAEASGPYLIGGWSSGGLIAFEVARQLTMSGGEVAMLAMFDSNPPRLGKSRRYRRWSSPGYLRRRGYRVTRRILGNVRHGLPWLYYRSRSRPVPTRRITWRLNRLSRRMMRAYVPGFYDGAITFFRAADGPRSLSSPKGWSSLAKEVEVIDTAGTHEGQTALVREPQAADLATKLQSLINERSR